MRDQNELIREAEKKLERLRPAWEAAREIVGDPARRAALEAKVLARVREILGAVPSPGRSADFLLGAAREALRPLDEPEEAIAAFERARREHRDLTRVTPEGEHARSESLSLP